MAMGQAQTQYGRLETQEQWAEEDFQREMERHMIRRGWQDDDFARALELAETQKAFFEEEIALRQQAMDISHELQLSELERARQSLEITKEHQELITQLQLQLQAAQDTAAAASQMWQLMLLTASQGVSTGSAFYEITKNWARELAGYGIEGSNPAENYRNYKNSLEQMCNAGNGIACELLAGEERLSRNPRAPVAFYNPYLPGQMINARISTGEQQLLRNLEQLPGPDVWSIAEMTERGLTQQAILARATPKLDGATLQSPTQVSVYDNPEVVRLLSGIAKALEKQPQQDRFGRKVQLEIFSGANEYETSLIDTLDLVL